VTIIGTGAFAIIGAVIQSRRKGLPHLVNLAVMFAAGLAGGATALLIYQLLFAPREWTDEDYEKFYCAGAYTFKEDYDRCMKTHEGQQTDESHCTSQGGRWDGHDCHRPN
jgi:hypothetical protein